MARADLSRVPEYFHKYINQVEEDDLMDVLEKQTRSFVRFLKEIPKDKRNYRYAEDKWTIKEVLLHIIDAERIFGYRALCFARKDPTSLPGFDENSYAVNSKADQRKWKDLVREFESVREATLSLFGSFDNDQLEASGTANAKPNYVLGIGFIVAGHVNHHVNVIKEKYLTSQ
ncbi:MAG: DinB family protein [Sphingobacteriales bacterium]|nr:DinB family protein [Sphingobacteriales bacterium]